MAAEWVAEVRSNVVKVRPSAALLAAIRWCEGPM